jgi:hypothetical protein
MGHRSTLNLALEANDSGEPSEDDKFANQNPFALPAFGSSSFWDQQREDTNSSSSVNTKNSNNLSQISNGIKICDEAASRKFQLQYTCKICDTRNAINVTRIAYRKGIVIATCKGCENRHLIADNLNWMSGFDYDSGERNIEQFMENRNEENDGEGEDLVVRVDKDVFDLEKMLYKKPDEDVLTSRETDDQFWG